MTDFGEFIEIFGIDHLIYIVCFLFVAVFLFIKKDFVQENSNRISKILLALSICQTIILYGSYFIFLDFDLSESLPFHISRVSTILIIVFLINKNPKLYKIISFFSLFALFSFIYPQRVHGVLHPIGLSFLINHTITLLMPFYGMIAYGLRISIGDRNFAFKWFLLYFLIVIFVNKIVDGNYFYLKYKPLGITWPNHIYYPLILIGTYIYFSLGEMIFIRLQDKIS